MFFFYSVTDVISNVAKYNTSVKIYLSKSKITDFKNHLKITKYTKKLLNYSNVSKSNSLLYTSDNDNLFLVIWHPHFLPQVDFALSLEGCSKYNGS